MANSHRPAAKPDSVPVTTALFRYRQSGLYTRRTSASSASSLANSTVAWPTSAPELSMACPDSACAVWLAFDAFIEGVIVMDGDPEGGGRLRFGGVQGTVDQGAVVPDQQVMLDEGLQVDIRVCEG